MGSELSDQYAILHAIKLIEDKLLRLNIDLEKIPQERDKLSSELKNHKEKFETAKLGFEAEQKRLRESELELKTKEEDLLKAEAKMMEVKSNEAYQAAMKENEGGKKEKEKLEEEILNLMSDMEQHKVQLQEAEKLYQESETKVKNALTGLDKDEHEVKSLLKEQLSTKAEEVSKLSVPVQDAYKIAKRQDKPSLIAIVDKGMCQSCHLRVRPQIYNEVIGMEQVHLCPHCHKILVLPKEETH